MSKFEKSNHWELPDSQKSQDECFHFSHSDIIVAGITSEEYHNNFEKNMYRTDPISRRVYYLRFFVFGCGYYSSNYPSNTPDKKL